jgi:hypothetical protein
VRQLPRRYRTIVRGRYPRRYLRIACGTGRNGRDCFITGAAIPVDGGRTL